MSDIKKEGGGLGWVKEAASEYNLVGAYKGLPPDIQKMTEGKIKPNKADLAGINNLIAEHESFLQTVSANDEGWGSTGGHALPAANVASENLTKLKSLKETLENE
jgi:hypothetical protein